MIMRVRVCVLCHLCLVSSGMCVCDTRLCVTVADVGDGIAGSVLRNQQPAWALDHPPKIGFSQIQTGIYLYVCSPKTIVLCIGYRTNLYPKHNWTFCSSAMTMTQGVREILQKCEIFTIIFHHH